MNENSHSMLETLLEAIPRPRFESRKFRYKAAILRTKSKRLATVLYTELKSLNVRKRTNKQINYPIKDSTFMEFIAPLKLATFCKHVARRGWRKMSNEELRNFYC
jgi:hypothetical protein